MENPLKEWVKEGVIPNSNVDEALNMFGKNEGLSFKNSKITYHSTCCSIKKN